MGIEDQPDCLHRYLRRRKLVAQKCDDYLLPPHLIQGIFILDGIVDTTSGPKPASPSATLWISSAGGQVEHGTSLWCDMS